MRSVSRFSSLFFTVGCVMIWASPWARAAVTVSPARAAVVISTQTQQFTASAVRLGVWTTLWGEI